MQLARKRQPVVLDAHPAVIRGAQRVVERLALRHRLAPRVKVRLAKLALLPGTPDLIVDHGELEHQRHQLPRLALVARVQQQTRGVGQVKRRIAGRHDSSGLTDQRFDIHAPTVTRAHASVVLFHTGITVATVASGVRYRIEAAASRSAQIVEREHFRGGAQFAHA